MYKKELVTHFVEKSAKETKKTNDVKSEEELKHLKT